jgi:protocatechuate 3,4-dioxygenase beta subunit
MGMKATIAALVTLLVTAGAFAGQDTQWVRQWEAAQQLKPARIASVGRIGSDKEPGTPFVARGTVLDPSGKPAAGVEVFAYQTDNTGLYARPGAADPWRLKGWAVTDAQGRFEFHTIRPGPYPNRDIPAHLHLSFATSCCGRQWSEVMFDDDPLGTPEYRLRSPDVLWGKIAKTAAGQETAYTFRLKARGDF